MSKQFSKETGNKMSALPATVGGLSVDIPVRTVRRALAIAELSGSDTISVTISLERLVSLTHTVACLVEQQLDEDVGQEKMSSDVEPGDGSGNRGAAALAAFPVSPVEDEQGPLVSGPEVGDIYSVGTDFCFRMTDLRRLDEEVDELMGSDVLTTRGTPSGNPIFISFKEHLVASMSIDMILKRIDLDLRAGSWVFALLMLFLCVVLNTMLSGKRLQLPCILPFGMLCLSAINMMFVTLCLR